MVERVEIKPIMLTWAIERSGQDVVAYLDAHPDVAAWVKLEKRPTVRQLEDFAKSVHVPFGYLFLSEPTHEEVPIPMFRGSSGVGTFNLNVYDTVLSVQRRQEWLTDYLVDNEYDICTCVGLVTLNTPVLETVQVLRRLLQLPENWAFSKRDSADAVNTLTEHIEELCIAVCFNSGVDNNNRRDIPVEECRGFALVNEIAPFVFVNNKDSKTAQLFTLIHETAHILLGKSAGFGGDLESIHDVTERYCDKVAASYLMPEDLVKQVWKDISSTARKFKVSEIAMARRAYELQLIDLDEYRTFYNEYKNRPIPVKNTGYGDFYATVTKRVGRLLAVHIVNAVRSHQLDYLQAYRLTGMYGNTYQTFVNRLE
jgi:Zn-dependent peptidase ImmA (M78 family)